MVRVRIVGGRVGFWGLVSYFEECDFCLREKEMMEDCRRGGVKELG